jgi:hypothetical protein
MSMNLHELKENLGRNPENTLSFTLPGGRAIPADFHVTEVGYVTKKFVDCGGIVHSAETCLLQVWLAANDKDHRLKAGKLASILDLAKPLIPSDGLEVEVEYGKTVVSQYSVATFSAGHGESRLGLANKHTDCLAREACGLESGCCS